MASQRPIALLVDDEVEFLKSLRERFELRGYDTLLAENGREAVETAKSRHIDLAVVDLKMPDMDGLACIAKIQELQPDVRTILLTAYGGDKIREATESLESVYFEKQDMGSFWDFLKRATKRLENAMAAAGLAEDGGRDEAMKIEREDRKGR
ncbi:MAG: two-component system, response regulator, stage 0 sporulation protein [Desulfovibrionales bacterium]|jgi:CheY-like chemotaxis protein|nr:two-component system, response regulator, stage 0 sporulation protein [Desulfovibrionales bacterium]